MELWLSHFIYVFICSLFTYAVRIHNLELSYGDNELQRKWKEAAIV